MEKLLDDGLIGGVLDITTTEVCDHLFGGVLACTDDRFGAVARSQAPYVGSCGALDMVNFGAMETVPQHYRGRKLYPHNPQITLMRTTVDENIQPSSLDRRAAEPVRRRGAIFAAIGWSLGAGRAGPGVLGSGCR